MRWLVLLFILIIGGCSDNQCTVCHEADTGKLTDGVLQDGIANGETTYADWGTHDGPWTDGTTAGTGTPQNCTPDKYFCYKTQMRRCTASGKDSLLWSDCADSDIASVKYNCVSCPSSSTGITCEADKPLITGSASGIVSFTYSYRPGCSPTSSAFISVSTAFGHSVTPYQGSSYPTLSIIASDIAQLPTGKSVPILFPASGIIVTLSKAKGTSCVNYGTNAPSLGTITVDHQGAIKGSTVTIALNAKLTCDSGTAWEAFTYNATGINP